MNSTIQTAWRILNTPVSTLLPVGFLQHGKIASTETSKVVEQTQKAAVDTAKRKQKATEVANNLGLPAEEVPVSVLYPLAHLAPEEQIIAWDHALEQTVNRKYPTVKTVREIIKELYPRSKSSTKESLSKTPEIEAEEEPEAERHDRDFFEQHFAEIGNKSRRLYLLLLSAPEWTQKICIYLLASIAQGMVTKSEILELLDPPRGPKDK